MKNLILVRHGKSSWEYSVSDKDRPLLERGISDAKLVANKFHENSFEIDAIFSSPANRALHTAMIFCRQMYLPFEKFRVSELPILSEIPILKTFLQVVLCIYN